LALSLILSGTGCSAGRSGAHNLPGGCYEAMSDKKYTVSLFQFLHKLVFSVEFKVQGNGVARILADETTRETCMFLKIRHSSVDPQCN
jgi:hypothetical protein